MPTTLKAAPICPQCGGPMLASAPAGLCPACLLARGAETEEAGPRPTPRFEPPPLAEVARLFPQLEILGLLGAGGMGAVYKARQPALDRLVALKLLPGGNRDGIDFASRFNREARALARLSHPNIVAVHEFGAAGGLHYFVMEFVDGANLRQLEQAGRLSPREALQIVPQICDALQYAHDEGVVHRDIKPENVMVDRKGRVKIADFGLAKIMGRDAGRAPLTVEGQVMGTPHYMAPEQIERPLAVDHRADIYSLGVVLYEMLTGDLPLGKFAPPSRKSGLDTRLDEVVLRALENDPARRYQQASEVKTRVETITTTAAPAGQAAGAGETPARRKYLHWAGFPVVMEFDGEREVNWNGTIGALTTALLLEAVGFISVWLVLGVARPAAPALQFCTFMTIALVLRGVRHTMNQPPAQELPRGKDGTVILPPAHPWWRSQRLAFAAIPFLVLAWCTFQIHWFEPQARVWFGPKPPEYGAVQLVEVKELLDFDTGNVGEFPMGDGKSHPLAGIGNNVIWMQSEGFDAEAGHRELHTLGMKLVSLGPDAWDKLAPADLDRRFPAPSAASDSGDRFQSAAILASQAVPSATYGFQTREGGMGMFQVAAWAERVPGATIRFKLIQQPRDRRK